MGNGYRYNHHHHHHQNINLHQKATFLPMLCSKPSMKDVALPRLKDRSMSFSSEPLSPKIGCMGQVKRHNNKIIGFPPNKITISSPLPSVKYSKLKRIFSAKNYSSSHPVLNTSSCRRKGASFNGGGREIGIKRVATKVVDYSEKKNSSVCAVNLDEMDPPLPVVKKVGSDIGSRESDSLWKRRSGGIGLKNLQLQQIQIHRHNLAPTTV